MWVSPVYKQSRIAWKMLGRIPNPVVHRIESRLEMTLWNGSEIMFGSADDPQNLEGHGINFLVCDEMQRLPATVWENTLRPSLADTKGKGLFFGRPLGKNHFYNLYTRGNGDVPGWRSFHFPTSSNPFIDADEIEEARLTLPHDVFQQEFMAEFLDNGAGVFRAVKDALRGYLQPIPVPGRRYAIGVDLGRKQDWTVLSVIDLMSGQFVAVDRFNKIDWPYQKGRIAALAQKYNGAVILIDSTGLGDPIYQDLKAAGMTIKPYPFTNESKKNLVENAVVAIEFERVHLPLDLPQVFLNELDTFEMDYTKSGKVTYGAPEGYHDDCVISLCLAIWEFHSYKPGVNIAWV